jgi:hypothetical protein
MKKFLLLILLCVSLIGCAKVEPEKPINWNINEEPLWEIWAQGEVLGLEIVRPDICDNNRKCAPSCLYHGTLLIKFENNEFAINQVKNPGSIKIGDVGTLYKYRDKKSDRYARWQWFPDGTAPWRYSPDKTTTVGKKTIAKKIAPATSTLINYNNWSEGKPERYVPVLIKFSNETLSVGYINNLNEWKLSINKREADNGRTIPNNEIIFWKTLDIQ